MQTTYVPGQAVRAYHKAKTGEISLIALKKALDEQDASELSTQIEFPVISKALALPHPRLPLDALGRPFFKVVNPYEETLPLVKAAVSRFFERQQCYPSVVLLSAFRYFTYGGLMEYYYVDRVRIPYAYEDGAIEDYYGLICRGGQR